jgi:uncharacterized protein (DUF1800 family)
MTRLPRTLRSQHVASLCGVLFSAALLVSLGGCASSASGSGSVSNGGGSVPTAPAVSVTVSGVSQARLGATVQFTATVSNATNSTVTWSVNGAAGGNATVGTITSAGLYTAPATMPSGGTVTITATSAASSSASGSATESILNPLPVVASGTATELVANGPYLLDVTGTGFVQGAQLTVGGTAVTTTFVSSTELQASLTSVGTATTLAVAAINPNPGTATSSSVAVATRQQFASIGTASRLLDQTTFGPTTDAIAHVQQVGVDAYLTEQFAQPTTTLAAIPTNPLPAVCLAANTPINCAESEWWQAAMTGNDQLRQRVAFALSEIFVVSTASIPGQAVPAFHNMLANDAFTNIRTLFYDVSVSPAMGYYLNMLNSAKPGNGQIANENYGREMMQLFSLGLYQLNADGTEKLSANGTPLDEFTEAQVQAFSRAYTGWTYSTATGASSTSFPNGTQNFNLPMAPVQAQHDVTAKVLLDGTTLPANQTALQDLNGALDNIFADANVGPFLCTQLIQHLVTSTPSPAYVKRVATVFANNGNGVRGDMMAILRAIFTDAEARAGDTNASYDGGHLREPMLYITSVMRGLGYVNTDVNSSYFSLSNYSNALSERPYRSPSVFNFFAPEYVIPDTTLNAPEFGLENTASVVLRLTLADNLSRDAITSFNTDLSATSTLGTLAANPANLVDSLGVLFMHGQMPATMRTTIINAITPLTNNAQRARIAIYLVISSSQYKVIH